MRLAARHNSRAPANAPQTTQQQTGLGVAGRMPTPTVLRWSHRKWRVVLRFESPVARHSMRKPSHELTTGGRSRTGHTRTAPRQQPTFRCDALRNQMLSRSAEVIEHVLLVEQLTSGVPFATILTAATNAASPSHPGNQQAQQASWSAQNGRQGGMKTHATTRTWRPRRHHRAPATTPSEEGRSTGQWRC